MNHSPLSKLGILDSPHERARLAEMHHNATAGKTLVLDEATGYLTPRGNQNLTNQFDAKRKVKFVELAKDLWPNLAAVCELVGVSKGTLKNHLAMDAKLRTELDNIREAAVDGVEKNMFVFSNRPSNFMDRIAIMRAYRGEIYNPKSTITIDHKITHEESDRRRMNLANAIDVEVIAKASEVLEAEVNTSRAEITVPAIRELRGKDPLAYIKEESDGS